MFLHLHIYFLQYKLTEGLYVHTGVEVSIQVTPVSTKDFQWVTNINYSSNANKLVTLSGKFVASTYLDTGTTGSPMW